MLAFNLVVLVIFRGFKVKNSKTLICGLNCFQQLQVNTLEPKPLSPEKLFSMFVLLHGTICDGSKNVKV